MGLSSAGGTNDPSKSLQYNVVKRPFEPLEGGRGNIFADPKCFSRIALADLALSRASLATPFLSNAVFSGPGKVIRAVADFIRPSLLAGRWVDSPLILGLTTKWRTCSSLDSL